MGETRRVCRHCGQPVTVAVPEHDGPLTAGASEHIGKAIHAGTGEEWCGDGMNLAAPIDAGMAVKPPAGVPQGRKPTPGELGVDLAKLTWERSGTTDDALEVAFPQGEWDPGDWVLMRLAGDSSGRVLVYDRNEWECFLDGARNGEFDDAAEPAPAT
jgi:hypothetical protein